MKFRALSNATKRFFSCRYVDVLVSVFCALVFIGVGGAQTVFGQTLFDLANHLSVETATLAPMLTVRAAGYGLGTAAAGPCFDRFIKFSFWLLTLIISIVCLSSNVLPFSVHPAMLGVVIFIQGIGIGSLNNGVHAVLMRKWRNKSGPTMQLIHFAYALGAFLAPLIAKPFLSEESSHNSTNLSCTQVLDMYDTGSGVPADISSCVSMAVQNCSNSSSLDGSAVIFTRVDCPMEPSLRYAWAYLILTLPLLIALPLFPLYAYRKQCCCKTAANPAVNGVNGLDPVKSIQEHASGELQKPYPDTVPYKIILFTLLALLMFVYVGVENSYGNFVFAYSVKSQLNFPKPRAALLASVFWGSFTFFRFFSIPLSLCGAPSWLMLTVNVAGGLVASAVLVIWPVNSTAVWIGSAILGSSMASIYPNTMVWLSEHGPATGKTIGVLLVGSTLGKMVLPAIIGYLVTTSSPVALFYSVLAGMLLSGTILLTLFVVAKSWMKLSAGTRRKEGGVSLYRMVTFNEDEVEEETAVLTWESSEKENEEEEGEGEVQE